MAQPNQIPKSRPTGWLRNPGGPTVEEAKADLLAAAEPVTTTRGGTKVPTFVQREATRGQGGNSPTVAYSPAEIADADESLRSGSQSSLPATPAPARVAVQPAAPAAEPEPQRGKWEPISHREVLDEPQFTIETYKDNRDKKWYGTITYKLDANGNQPGGERYIADSQAELTLKIIKGKAHSTLKIRSLTQSHKLGSKPDLSDYFATELHNTHNLTPAEFNALPPKTRIAITDTMYAAEAMLFKDQHPEYNLGTLDGSKNLQMVIAHVRKQGWPITHRNLEIGWNDLEAAKTIQVVEPSPALTHSTTPIVPAQPQRKRGCTSLVPGASSGNWGGGADDDTTRAREAAAQASQSNGGMTPEQRVRELSKTKEGMAQLKKEMRAGYKTAQPSYRG